MLVPERPSDVLSLQNTVTAIADVIESIYDLEDRLKDMLETGDNDCYEDQIDEYIRDLEESAKTLRALKPTLTPERLREGEVGKSDVSWLSWRRNTLGARLHREINELLAVLDGPEESADDIRARLRAADLLLQTATAMLQSAQYLSWFTRRVVEHNETVHELDRDFTVSLVAQWVQEEACKMLEHHRNCVNLRSELIQKLDGSIRRRSGASDVRSLRPSTATIPTTTTAAASAAAAADDSG